MPTDVMRNWFRDKRSDLTTGTFICKVRLVSRDYVIYIFVLQESSRLHRTVPGLITGSANTLRGRAAWE